MARNLDDASFCC